MHHGALDKSLAILSLHFLLWEAESPLKPGGLPGCCKTKLTVHVLAWAALGDCGTQMQHSGE